MFFLPRLSTLWGPYLSNLPRWMRANALKETLRNLQLEGTYPPNLFDPVSYFYGTEDISGYGPTWGALAGPFIAVGIGNNPPDILQQDSLLARIFTSVWPVWNHLAYQQEVLSFFRECFYPVMGIEDRIWKASSLIPSQIVSVDYLYNNTWTEVPQSTSLFSLTWRPTPSWTQAKHGLFLYGIDFKESWAYSDPPSLKLPDPTDRIPDTDVWICHPRTMQWLKIPSLEVNSQGEFDFFWEPDTPLPRIRWQSVSVSAALSASGFVRLNATSFSSGNPLFMSTSSLEQVTLWNTVDELALTYDVERQELEKNRDFWTRLSYQIGYFTGQAPRPLALYLANQFGLLDTATISSSTLSYSFDYPYFIFPELQKDRYPIENLTLINNPNVFRSKYEFASYSAYKKGAFFLTGTASSGLVTITENLPSSSSVQAFWMIPQWSQSSTGITFYPENIAEGTYDLFLAPEVDVELCNHKQNNRQWNSAEEEETPFTGLATFD